MSGAVSEEFQEECRKFLVSHEDRIRENIEQIILNNKAVEKEYLDLEGIDPSQNSSKEVKKHLDEEVTEILNRLYKGIDNGEAFRPLNKLAANLETQKDSTEEFQELLKKEASKREQPHLVRGLSFGLSGLIVFVMAMTMYFEILSNSTPEQSIFWPTMFLAAYFEIINHSGNDMEEVEMYLELREEFKNLMLNPKNKF